MRIGLFGGTFDPVHMGHLILAENARKLAGLDKVLFMPVNIQPFKQDRKVTDADDRLRMLAAAVETNACFGVTKIELELSGVSYTIDSLRAFAAKLDPGDEAVFILGADMFMNIEKWYRSDELLRDFEIVAGRRPGTDSAELAGFAAGLKSRYGARITEVDNPLVDISGTDIRGEASGGGTFRYMVPDDVWRYLYAKGRLPEKKFAHTKRVMDLAVEWAGKNGVDTHKAWTAALLHDIEKDKGQGVSNDLYHGRLAAATAKSELGVLDEDTLNAISWHTMGRGGMSRLEMIIFAADTVEPGRRYKGAERLRKLCEEDLTAGTLQVLIELRDYLERKGILPSDETLEAIAYLSKMRENSMWGFQTSR
ncbi:MAG: nicotinate-nucleotide adenylyltransferase [Clostridiales Family XIII bacterium]|jgi:nicotinate-nucleotide adenylyltransferase|nr:nicotinate-nucleotide adenylyltransferase [Clostridiales Family XIII bacterium]